MGYTTHFYGELTITPPLTHHVTTVDLVIDLATSLVRELVSERARR